MKLEVALSPTDAFPKVTRVKALADAPGETLWMFNRGPLAAVGFERMPFILFRILPELAMAVGCRACVRTPMGESRDDGRVRPPSLCRERVSAADAEPHVRCDRVDLGRGLRGDHGRTLPSNRSRPRCRPRFSRVAVMKRRGTCAAA